MADIDEVNAAQTSKLVGSDTDGTEQTPVGSTSSGRLKVESQPTSGAALIPSLGTNLAYDDMNASTGGVARGTTITNAWTKIYDSTLAPVPGTSGLMSSLVITLEKIDENDPVKAWVFRLVIDGFEVFGSDGILSTDLQDKEVYGFILDPSKNIPEWAGFSLKGSSIRWEGPNNFPIAYSSGVQVYIKKLDDNKKFRAGLAVLTKE